MTPHNHAPQPVAGQPPGVPVCTGGSGNAAGTAIKTLYSAPRHHAPQLTPASRGQAAAWQTHGQQCRSWYSKRDANALSTTPRSHVPQRTPASGRPSRGVADASAAGSGVALGTERRASISAAVCCQCSAATWLASGPLPGEVAWAPASAPRRVTGAASLRVSYNSTTPAACRQRTVLHVGFARQHLLNVRQKSPLQGAPEELMSV